jgi:ankyrin repeat protein
MASIANERLRVAAMNGDVSGIAAALLAGADLEALDGAYVMTPLQWAARYGHVAAIAALLAAGAQVDGVHRSGNMPLLNAASNGHAAAIDALLAAGADVNRANNCGHTALHCASDAGHVDAARVLLRAGARSDVVNCYGVRPIDRVRVLVAVAQYCHAAVPPRCNAQVCIVAYASTSAAPALRALFASAAPWSRRRPVALACYGVEWEWEA